MEINKRYIADVDFKKGTVKYTTLINITDTICKLSETDPREFYLRLQLGVSQKASSFYARTFYIHLN